MIATADPAAAHLALLVAAIERENAALRMIGELLDRLEGLERRVAALEERLAVQHLAAEQDARAALDLYLAAGGLLN